MTYHRKAVSDNVSFFILKMLSGYDIDVVPISNLKVISPIKTVLYDCPSVSI